MKPPEFMQLDGMIEELSNLLCNFCCKVLTGMLRLWDVENSINLPEFSVRHRIRPYGVFQHRPADVIS